MLKFAKIFFICFLIWLSMAGLSFSDQFLLPKSTFPTTKPIKKEMYKTFFYNTREYKPDVKVKTLTSRTKLESSATPEDTVISFYSAIFAADYDWYSTLWTDKSQLYMTDREQKRPRLKPEKVILVWKQEFSDARVELTRRVDVEDFVVIEARITSKKNNKSKILMTTTPLELENGIWKVTASFSQNPLMHFWKNEESAPEYMEKTHGAVSYVIQTLDNSEHNASIDKLTYKVEHRKSKFPLTKSIRKKLVKTYYYFVRDYTMPIKVSLNNSDEVSYSSPELAVISYLSAMYSGDFERYLEGWTGYSKGIMKNLIFDINVKESGVDQPTWEQFYGEATRFRWYFQGWSKQAQKSKIDRNKNSLEFTKKEMLSAWEKGLAGTHAEITKRLDRGDFVFVEVAIISNVNSKQIRNFSVPIKKKADGVWKLTLSPVIINTPVLLWWNDEEAAKKRKYIIR